MAPVSAEELVILEAGLAGLETRLQNKPQPQGTAQTSRAQTLLGTDDSKSDSKSDSLAFGLRPKSQVSMFSGKPTKARPQTLMESCSASCQTLPLPKTRTGECRGAAMKERMGIPVQTQCQKRSHLYHTGQQHKPSVLGTQSAPPP